jgi:hypothetical protein
MYPSQLYICDMMRKISVLVLLTLYSAVAIGVPLHYHYCGGELQHITLFAPKECESHDVAHKKVEEPQACCQGKAISHCNDETSGPDCCEDQTELLQLDDRVAALVLLQGKYADAIVVCEFAELPSIQQKEAVNSDITYVQPPPLVQSYLEHCSLIFYG